MHMVNKISHLVRGNFFKVAIFILVVIYLYKFGSETSDQTSDESDDKHKTFLKLFLKNRLSDGDKLIQELSLNEQQAFLDGYQNPRKRKYKAASKQKLTYNAMDEVKRIKPTHSLKSSGETEDDQFDIRDLTFRKYDVDNYDDEKPKVQSSKRKSLQSSNRSAAGNRKHPRRKRILRRKNQKTDLAEKPDQKMLKLFADNKLRTKFRSKEEMVQYISRKNQREEKPVFGYINMQWNSGGRADYYNRDLVTEKPAGRNLCHNWTYNAADYTLVYKPWTWYQNESCPLPFNETIKKIVLPNKKVVWKGCTRKTTSCSESPFFDEAKGLRRNVPPCCRRHLLEMMKNIDQELMRRNITYTLTDGVVIGWYRNQKLVPYDADLDMYIDGAYYKTRVWDEVFGNLTTKHGYQYEQVEDYKFKLQFSAINSLTVDIWPYFNIKLRTQYGLVQPGEWLTFVYHSGTTAMRVDEFFPPKRTTVEGVPCNVPRDAVHYLNLNFGPTPDNWMKELTCKRLKFYNCIS